MWGNLTLYLNLVHSMTHKTILDCHLTGQGGVCRAHLNIFAFQDRMCTVLLSYILKIILIELIHSINLTQAHLLEVHSHIRQCRLCYQKIHHLPSFPCLSLACRKFHHHNSRCHHRRHVYRDQIDTHRGCKEGEKIMESHEKNLRCA